MGTLKPMSDLPRVANAAQAALLLDPAYEAVLDALVKAGTCATGAAALARSAGQPLSTVHARLEKLRVAGVVDVAAVQARAGRPVRLYVLPLPWRVPFEVTPAATLRELLGGSFGQHIERQLDALAGRMLHLSAGWHVTVSGVEEGLKLSVEAAGEEIRGEPLAGFGFALRLRRERANEFLKCLHVLLTEYRDTPDPEEDAPTWLGTFIFTPGLET